MSSCTCGEFLNGFGIETLVMLDGHGHKELAFGGDFPATGSGHFGDEAVDVQALEYAGDSGTLTALGSLVDGHREDDLADITIAESSNGMFATHDGAEHENILFGGGIESAKGSRSFADRFCALAEQLTGRGGVVDDGQSIDVSLIGPEGDLSVLVEVRNAFGHGAPGHKGFAVSYALAPDPKVLRVVDDGFDPQDKPMLVVHFDPIGFNAVLDTRTGPPLFELRNDFSFEDPVESLSEEGHHVLGAETQRCVLQQFGIQVLQIRWAPEHYIGGELGLIGHPVVVHIGDERVEQGVEALSETAEDPRPIEILELIGEALSSLRIGNSGKGVVELPEVHVVSLHLSGQPLMAVETNLNGKRDPTLQPHMHQAEGWIDEVKVNAQTLASSGYDVWTIFADGDCEGVAQFQRGKDTNQPPGNAVALGNAAGLLLLTDLSAVEVLEGPSTPFGDFDGVLLDPFGLFGDKGLEVLDQQATQSHELLQSFRPTDGAQMPSKNNAINTGQRPHDFIGMFANKFVHGVPSRCCPLLYPYYERRMLFLLAPHVNLWANSGMGSFPRQCNCIRLNHFSLL